MKKRIAAIIILVFMLLPLLSLTAVSADGETLPKGFVRPEDYYEKWEEYDKDNLKSVLFSLNKMDGVYLQLLYVECGNCGTYGFYPDMREEYDRKSTLSDKPYITVRRGETVPTFTLSGTYDYEGEKDWYGEPQWRKSTMTVTVQNMTLGPIGPAGGSYVYADISGSASTQWKREGKDVQSGTTTVDAKQVQNRDSDWDSSMQYNFDGIGLSLTASGTYSGDSLGFTGYITIWFKLIGILPSDGSKTSSGTTQNAEQNAGEDKGVSVPAAIAIGVVGAVIAITGAAAATSGRGDGGDDDKNKKSYKMYVQKDFGDAIRKGAEPVKVRARMAEVSEAGAEQDRNDLTAKITASGDGMTVERTELVGRYLEAVVSIPKDYEDDKAEITFTFTGVGGVFTNTVIFRAVDGPSLKFVEETEEAGAYRLNESSCGIDLIPGDNFTYTAQFMIIDAVTPPSVGDMTAENPGDFGVTFEETGRQFVYKMNVKNNTAPEPDHDVFAEKKTRSFEIKVKVEGEEKPVTGYVSVNLYPEGITVQSSEIGKKNEVKYVRVQAYEKENVGDFDSKWQVCEMKLTAAFKLKDKSVIDPENAKFGFEKIKGSGGTGMRADKEESVAEKFKYKETHGYSSGKYEYVFEPNSSLSEPDDGTFYMVLLPTEAEYEGVRYKAEVPLRLRGSDLGAKGDWEREYKELQRRIIQFSLPGNMDKWLAQLKTCALEPRASVEELRLVSKWILREYMDYWTNQQKKDLDEANMYNAIVNVLEWTKFAGDCAFSFLVAAYAGPVAEALISPAKDFFTSAIGEIVAARSHGDAIDVDNFEFSKNLAAAGDNLLSNNINLTNWRQAAATLGGYFVYSAVKNYILKLREKNEADLWGALCEAFKDMTVAALKSKAGELIGKWIKESKKFQEKIGPFITKYFKETNFETLQKKINDSLGLDGDLRKAVGYANDKIFETKVAEVVEKYISSLVGAGFDKVREVYDGSKFVVEGGCVCYCFNIDLFDAFHYGIKLNLTRILQAMSGNFFGWLYDLFFAGVPAAPSVIEKPKDPPLPPAKN